MAAIISRIKKFNANRLPEYTAIKYSMMAENAFRFFRGTCHLFYEDLSKVTVLPSSPLVWISGDLHIENFGSYKADNRLVYFDLNDFDEAVLASALWEVTRMTCSILVAFDSLKIKQKDALQFASLFLEKYISTLLKGKPRYIDARAAKGIVKSFLRQVEERKQKELIYKACIKTAKGLRFDIDSRHLFKVAKQEKKMLIDVFAKWLKNNRKGYLKNCEIYDVCFRVAGTGSIGLRSYVFLLKNINIPNRFLLIDMKQAVSSSLDPYLKNKQPDWESEAQRTVTIQEWMQNESPALLGTINYNENSYVVKELQPMEDKVNFFVIKDEYDDTCQVIEDMAILAASAQLRSSGRHGAAIADKLVDFGKNSKWQDAVLDYSIKYARKVKEDYTVFLKEYKSGSL